ncbi:MAG: tetratricopeptide repeat protein [Planctomycetes bacterium]|nr:tetratricopeptide repeat protein [Planctomycetota bacterium]
MSFDQFKILSLGLLLLALIGCDKQSASSTATANNPSQPEVTPQSIDIALASADEYLNRQDYPSAELILRKLIEKAPSEGRAYELYGKSLLTRALLPEAQTDPDEKSKLLNQSYEQYDKAAELTQALSNDSQWAADLHQSAGEIASMAKRPDDALKHFLLAGKLSAANPKHALYAAQFLMDKGLLDEAERELQRVLVIDPDQPYALASLAAVAVQREDYAMAISRIEAARKIAPRDLGLRIQEAKIRRLAGQPLRGIQLLILLDDQVRVQTAVTEEIAECYFALDEPLKAVEAWEYRYDITETFLAAIQVAEACIRAGRYEDALRWIDQASLLEPDSPVLDSLRDQLQSMNSER